MAWTHKDLLNGIVTYLTTNLDNPTTDYNYIGLLPKVESSGDFKNIPPGLFPLVGVLLDEVDYNQNGSQGTNSPTMSVQIVFAVRQSGANPQEDQEFVLEKIEEMQDLLFTTERGTRFDMPDEILGMTVLGLATFPTFYTQVDQNRKAYSIGVYPLELYLSSI